MADIKNEEDLINWFSNSRSDFNIRNIKKLVKYGNYDNDLPQLWNYIYDYSLCRPFVRNAYITRQGNVWTCGWGQHELMLDIMGVKHTEAEEAGWLRISGPSPQYIRASIRKPMSPKQKKFIAGLKIPSLKEDYDSMDIFTNERIITYDKVY